MQPLHQEKSKELQLQATTQKTKAPIADTIFRCHKCGSLHASDDRFCAECGAKVNCSACHKCGATIKPGLELCPHCGENLLVEVCPFCGKPTTTEDVFCSECGNLKSGIRCPNCNTLNFRSFCRKCNTPLNEQAQQAIFLAKKDPKVQKTAQLLSELGQLEKQILLHATPTSNNATLSDDDLKLLNEHKALLASIRGIKLEDAKPSDKKSSTHNNISFTINELTKEEAIEQYKAKLAEMQEILSAMIPDANMTPQMQRDFHSARKVEIETLTKQKVPIGWICNAYGCMHSQPSECAEPYSGGKWIYEEREVLTKIWANV